MDISSSEPEDGEISSSDDDDDDDDDVTDDDINDPQPTTTVATPCIRVVVVESTESMPVGKLFIVTCTGWLA